MKTAKSYTVGLLALALIGAAVLLHRDHSKLADLRSQLDAAAQIRHRLESEVAADHFGFAQRDQRIADLARRFRAADTRVRNLESRVEGTHGGSGASSMSEPGAAQFQSARLRRQMEKRYGALAKRLGLTPAQTERFMDLLVDKRMVATDATAAALRERGGALGDSSDFAALMAMSDDDIENQIQALPGDQGYAQNLRANATVGQSGTIVRLQTALAGTEPLTDVPLAQLQQLLADSHVGHLTIQVMVKAQSQGFLDAVQMQALQTIFQQQRAAMQSRQAPQLAPAGPGNR